MVYGTGLENRRSLTATVSSNLTPSAIFTRSHSGVFYADLLRRSSALMSTPNSLFFSTCS